MRVLSDRDITVIDKGDEQRKPDDDFPQFAEQVVRAMQSSDDKDAAASSSAEAVRVCAWRQIASKEYGRA